MRILVIRHTDAGDRAGWNGDDHLRPLSEVGRRQAEQLVDVLAGHPVARILTSPYVRCVESVEPLARARGLEVEHADRLAEGTPGHDAVELLLQVADRPTVLCSHGDVVGSVVLALPRLGAVLSHAPRWQKGSTWVLDVDGGAVTSATYLAPST